MRFVNALRHDMKLQIRYGFYAAYILISGAYIGLLYLMPAAWRELAALLLTFSDPSMLGFFFIGGIILLERGQGIHDSLLVTPLRPEQYLLSKCLSLMLLSIGSVTVIHLAVFGQSVQLAGLLIGVALTSLLFTLFGIGIAVQCRSLNGFFLRAAFYTPPLMLPLTETIVGWQHPLLWLLPSKLSLVLLASGYQSISTAEYIICTLGLIAWNGLVFVWARGLFYRYVVNRVGEGVNLQ